MSVLVQKLDNQFGLFWIPVSGALVAVRLNHVSGTVSCSRGSKSFWGCGTLPSLESIRIIITNSSDYALLPQKPQVFYTIPGYNSNSPQLVFPDFQPPLAVYSGQELRVWYSEDWKDVHEGDNSGLSCADVYAKII